jgi:hypothetical protein
MAASNPRYGAGKFTALDFCLRPRLASLKSMRTQSMRTQAGVPSPHPYTLFLFLPDSFLFSPSFLFPLGPSCPICALIHICTCIGFSLASAGAPVGPHAQLLPAKLQRYDSIPFCGISGLISLWYLTVCLFLLLQLSLSIHGFSGLNSFA